MLPYREKSYPVLSGFPMSLDLVFLYKPWQEPEAPEMTIFCFALRSAVSEDRLEGGLRQW